jgi:hypothetical protein
MAQARVRGASIRANDRLLLRALFEAFLPFVVFAMVAAAGRDLAAWQLALILLGRTLGDVLVDRGVGLPDATRYRRGGP